MNKSLSLILIQPSVKVPDVLIEKFSVLDLDTNLLDQEEGLREVGIPVNAKIQVRDPNYGLFEIEKDMYGNPFFYVSPIYVACALSEVKELSQWDQSILKFVKSLRPEIKVVPWWH